MGGNVVECAHRAYMDDATEIRPMNDWANRQQSESPERGHGVPVRRAEVRIRNASSMVPIAQNGLPATVFRVTPAGENSLPKAIPKEDAERDST